MQLSIFLIFFFSLSASLARLAAIPTSSNTTESAITQWIDESPSIALPDPVLTGTTLEKRAGTKASASHGKGKKVSNAQKGKKVSKSKKGKKGPASKKGKKGPASKKGKKGPASKKGKKVPASKKGKKGTNSQKGKKGANSQKKGPYPLPKAVIDKKSKALKAPAGTKFLDKPPNPKGSKKQTGKKGATHASNKKGKQSGKATSHGKSSTHKKASSGHKATSKKSTHRRDLTSDESSNSIVRKNFTSADVAPPGTHDQTHILSKRVLPYQWVAEGHTGVGSHEHDLYTSGLIQCTLILAIDTYGRKVMSHIYPGDPSLPNPYGTYQTQYATFKQAVATHLTPTNVMIYISAPGHGQEAQAMQAVDWIHRSLVHDYRTSLPQHGHHIWVAQRAANVNAVHTLQDGSLQSTTQYVSAWVKTTDHRPTFGGQWEQNVVNEHGHSSTTVLQHDQRATHQQTTWNFGA